MKAGWIFRPGSMWIGVHFSKAHKRACINFIPMLTFWVILEGGDIPEGHGWV